MKMRKIKAIYFYNGYSEPELLATSLRQFIKKIANQDLTLTEQNTLFAKHRVSAQTYDYLIDAMKDYEKGLLHREEVGWDYDIMVDPTLEDFVYRNTSFGLDEHDYLENLIFDPKNNNVVRPRISKLAEVIAIIKEPTRAE